MEWMLTFQDGTETEMDRGENRGKASELASSGFEIPGLAARSHAIIPEWFS